MQKLRNYVRLLCMISVVCTTTHAFQVVKVAEVSLRKAAYKKVMPDFSPEAVKQNAQGIAVAELVVDESGNVVKVDVLESPHPLVTEAVSEAVGQWRFNVTTLKGTPVSLRGKLTFYYVIDERGVGRVDNPRKVK
jgi:outer membrane biosynthesis protein TonB